MHDKRRRFRRQARPALLWTLLFFLTGHLLVGLYLHRHHPEFFDPEVTLRLHKLPARLAETPGRPLALAIGSSRLVFGLRPTSVMEQARDVADEPLLFNFSMLGAGPVGQRMLLQRLLRKGFQPQWLFLEVWPPFWTPEYPAVEAGRAFSRDMYWSDVPIVGRLYDRRAEAAGQVIDQTLTPLLYYRDSVCRHYAPKLLGGASGQLCQGDGGNLWEKCLDDFGWVPFHVPADPAHLTRLRHILAPLVDNLVLNEISQSALRDLLEECRSHRIRVVFLLMPEHRLVRDWFPLLRGQLMPYLHRLSIENHAPIIDARGWQSEQDLPDYCHLSPRAARTFSERFGREVFRPLIQGKPLAHDILMGDSERPRTDDLQ